MRIKPLLIAAVLALTFGSASNAESQWTPVGPQGGAITSFASIGQYIFAGTDGNPNYSGQYQGIPGNGVYRSSDSGASWKEVNTGLTDTNITALTSAGSVVIAGTEYGGLFRSTDDGTSWTDFSGQKIRHTITAFAVIGQNLFAATDGGGILRSTNLGITWISDTSSFKGNHNFNSLAVIGSYLFACTSFNPYSGAQNRGQIFLSTNSGSSWTLLTNGFRNMAAIGTRLIGCTYQDTALFSSPDTGKTWFRADTNIKQYYRPLLEYAYLSEGVLLAAGECFDCDDNFVSFDSGKTWIGTPVSTFQSFHSFGGYLYGGGNGIFRSSDSGATWTQSNKGMYRYEMRPIEILILVDAGSYLYASGLNEPVLRSEDNGVHWDTVDTKYRNWGSLKTTISMGPNLIIGSWDTGICQSTDNGATWNILSNHNSIGIPWELVALGTYLFANIDGYTDGIYRSADSGKHWVHAASGLTYTSDGLTYNYVDFLGSSGTDLFTTALYNGAVFRSTDSARTWKQIAVIPDNDISALSSNGTSVFIGSCDPRSSNGPHVFRTSDEGNNWVGSFVGGLNSSNSGVRAMKAFGTNVIAATAGGVFVSTDDALSWTAVNAGLSDTTNITAFAICGGYLFASSQYYGMWRRPLTDFPVSHSAIQKQVITSAIDLFPNPTDGILAVHADNIEHVTVENLLGERVFEVASPSPSDFSLDLSKLPAGIYFARFEMASRGVVMKKVVKE